MDDVTAIELAAERMRQDPDPRWWLVANLLTGVPLGYARMLTGHPQRHRLARDYPDAARAADVARAYLGEG